MSSGIVNEHSTEDEILALPDAESIHMSSDQCTVASYSDSMRMSDHQLSDQSDLYQYTASQQADRQFCISHISPS